MAKEVCKRCREIQTLDEALASLEISVARYGSTIKNDRYKREWRKKRDELRKEKCSCKFYLMQR